MELHLRLVSTLVPCVTSVLTTYMIYSQMIYQVLKKYNLDATNAALHHPETSISALNLQYFGLLDNILLKILIST